MVRKRDKAQGEIITTVLIVLLVLAAIVIVYSAVKKVISEKSGQIDVNIATVDLSIQNAVVDSALAKARVDATRGSDSADLASIRIVLEGKAGTTPKNFIIDVTPMGKLEVRAYEFDFSSSGLTIVENVKVAPVSKTGKFGPMVSKKPVTGSLPNCNSGQWACNGVNYRLCVGGVWVDQGPNPLCGYTEPTEPTSCEAAWGFGYGYGCGDGWWGYGYGICCGGNHQSDNWGYGYGCGYGWEEGYGYGCTAGLCLSGTYVTGYGDGDGDGYGYGSNYEFCDSVPSGYSYMDGDCDDWDSSVWNGGDFYVNSDYDSCGYGSSVSVCYGNNYPPYGFSSNSGDCDDWDGSAWQWGYGYVDSDYDSCGYGSSVSVCYGNIYPPYGYSTDSDDCDDGDSSVCLYC